MPPLLTLHLVGMEHIRASLVNRHVMDHRLLIILLFIMRHGFSLKKRHQMVMQNFKLAALYINVKLDRRNVRANVYLVKLMRRIVENVLMAWNI